MRVLGVAAVILGMAALTFIAMDSVQTAIFGVSGHATAEGNGQEVPRLIFWATFVGVIALAALARGLGDVAMSRLEWNRPEPERAPNGEMAAMIDAEANEGGPASPVPCARPSKARPVIRSMRL